MHSQFAFLVILTISASISGEKVKSRVNLSKDIKLSNVDLESAGKPQNSRQGRFFGLLSLLAGLSLSEGFLFDSDPWTDSHEAGVNIKTKIQTNPYGIGWPYGPRYVPVLIPTSYFNALKYFPDQKPLNTHNQQIVNVDSPMKMESYKEVSVTSGQKNPERFTREAAEMESNATVQEILDNKPVNQSESPMEVIDVVDITSEAPAKIPESSEMSEIHEQTTPMSFEVGMIGMIPETAQHAENLTLNELEKPPSWNPPENSSYYRKYPPKDGLNIDDIRFTTLYPPLGTPPPNEPFEASPQDETSFRRAPENFQPIIQVPLFWGSG